MRQQYKITLGDDLRAKLEAASTKSGRPMSEEIRERLERSLDADVFDEQTRELASLIPKLAAEAETELGAKWHDDGGAHRVFRRMFVRALSKWRPSGYNDNLMTEVPVTPFNVRAHASQPINDADQLGIALADMVLTTPDDASRGKVREAQEQTLKEIVKLQKSRGVEGND
ncbi:hypothetical protein IVA88_12515 [Bradyrhizobium sp. 149]|uniref:hypothetical protein n=1 Tax=Bradyrhizobium sp. 149 TaxID=2782624 RepID=UPI001FF9A9D2|nr:hypothetical protein [Bradyrhizobium sp. 149]MCK1652256.1 hypothetical protein [Bradyrhizobium sp. 149]